MLKDRVSNYFNCIDQPFEERDDDFKVAICKFYKLDKKSPTDFHVVQVVQVVPPPIPLLDIFQKKKVDESKGGQKFGVSVGFGIFGNNTFQKGILLFN